MGLPSISQYADSIDHPHGLFRTLGEFTPVRDMYGQVQIVAGNSAAIFRISTPELPAAALKCYIKPSPYLREIYGYLGTHPDPLLVPARLLPEEIFVYDLFGEGSYHDVVLSQWAEGQTLERSIREAAREGCQERLEALARGFDTLTWELLGREWAHGDLKPENIVVCDDGRMVLIDYDTLFIPPLAGRCACGIGTPAYQHPARDENLYDNSLDDYPAALISVSLHALALDPELYVRYNRSDNLLFYPGEVLSDQSAAYDEILSLFAAHSAHRRYRLAQMLRSQTPRLEGVRDLLQETVASTPQDPDQPPVLFTQEGRWGYAASDGSIRIEAIYDDATEFNEGVASVCLRGRWQVIDTEGKIIIGPKLEFIKPFSEGLAAAREEGHWGYIDHQGQWVVAPTFDAAGSMHEGRAAVRINGKYGYINPQGQMVIAPQFDHAGGFRNGQATVYLADTPLLINQNGEVCP